MLDIIAVIISIVALLVSIYFSFYTSRPHIKIEPLTGVYSKNKNFVCLLIDYSNGSPMGGEIKEVTLKVKNKTYFAINSNEIKDLSFIELASNKNKVNVNKVNKTYPIMVLPFTSGIAFACFFVDCSDFVDSVVLDCYFKFVGFKFRRRISYKYVPVDSVDNNSNNSQNQRNTSNN